MAREPRGALLEAPEQHYQSEPEQDDNPDVQQEMESLQEMVARLVAEGVAAQMQQLLVTGNDKRLYSGPEMRQADLNMEKVVAAMPKIQCIINPDPDLPPNSEGRYPDHTFSINGVNYIYPVGVPVEMPVEMYLIGVRAKRIFPQRPQDAYEVRPIDPEIIAAKRFSEIPRAMGYAG